MCAAKIKMKYFFILNNQATNTSMNIVHIKQMQHTLR